MPISARSERASRLLFFSARSFQSDRAAIAQPTVFDVEQLTAKTAGRPVGNFLTTVEFGDCNLASVAQTGTDVELLSANLTHARSEHSRSRLVRYAARAIRSTA